MYNTKINSENKKNNFYRLLLGKMLLYQILAYIINRKI